MAEENQIWVIVRGGGDLASGAVLRLWRAGLRVLVLELPQPVVVRRLVAYAEAIYQNTTTVEESRACRVSDLQQARHAVQDGLVPVLVDPQASVLAVLRATGAPLVLVDGRMTKRPPDLPHPAADFTVGLGPGFTAGENCHAVIETQRGHWLGRVLWAGSAAPDSGQPERVGNFGSERVLRAPAGGCFETQAEIGQRVAAGQLLAQVGGHSLVAPFDGVLRGLLHSGLVVTPGMKVGDLDPRGDLHTCALVSDKALAVGGAVLEAILSRAELRPWLWAGAG